MKLSRLIEMLTPFRRGWAADPEVVVEVEGKLYPLVGYHFRAVGDDECTAEARSLVDGDRPSKMVLQTKVEF